jgi:hypothetical protein
VEADVVLGERYIYAYCYKHLEGNLKEKFGSKGGLPKLFWKAAQAQSLLGFEHHMAKVEALNPIAIEYLRSIPLELWTIAHFPRTRHSHLTSNIAKSINKILYKDRTLSIMELLDAIWHRVISERTTHLKEAQKQVAKVVRFTSYYSTKLAYLQKWVLSNMVSLFSMYFEGYN